MQYILSQEEYDSLKQNKELKECKQLIQNMFDNMTTEEIIGIRDKLIYPFQDLYDKEYSKFFYGHD